MQPCPIGGRLGHDEPLLAPHDAGQLLHQVVLGRSVRRVLGDQALQQVVVFAPILPGQHPVPREDAVPEGVEPAPLVADRARPTVAWSRRTLLMTRSPSTVVA